jgi:hypothetical protein
MKTLYLATLVLVGFGLYAQSDSTKNLKSAKQYDKRITFDISIEPGAFFDINARTTAANNFIRPGLEPTISTSRLDLQQYGGMDLGVGVAIKRKFHFNLLTGFSSNANVSWIPVGGDFKFNFPDEKWSPYFHLGGGYMYEAFNRGWNSYYVTTSDNGAFGTLGIGAYCKVSKFYSIFLSPEYRFIYSEVRYGLKEVVSPLLEYGYAWQGIANSQKLMCNQVGLKLGFIFY